METKFLDNVGEELPETQRQGGFGKTSQFNKEIAKDWGLDCFAKLKASGKERLAFPIYTIWDKVYKGVSMNERNKRKSEWWNAYELMCVVRELIDNSKPRMKTAINRDRKVGSKDDKCNYIVFYAKPQ